MKTLIGNMWIKLGGCKDEYGWFATTAACFLSFDRPTSCAAQCFRTIFPSSTRADKQITFTLSRIFGLSVARYNKHLHKHSPKTFARAFHTQSLWQTSGHVPQYQYVCPARGYNRVVYYVHLWTNWAVSTPWTLVVTEQFFCLFF